MTIQGKALTEVKAQLMEGDELDAWVAGRIPRRLLAIPYDGPIPSGKHKRGVDLDGQWFSPKTDLYGPYTALRHSRERYVDFHHAKSPKMGKAILGRVIIDEEPEEDGLWVDFWLKAGEQRVQLVKALAERGAQLFGSSQAVYGKADEQTGEILEWPWYLETISTSPVNTWSVIRPLKAALDSDDLSAAALRALAVGIDNLGEDLRLTSAVVQGEDEAKAGRVLSSANDADLEASLRDYADGIQGVVAGQDVRNALRQLAAGYERLHGLLERARQRHKEE